MTPLRPDHRPTSLDRLARRATWVLVWERLWPVMAALFVVFAAFLAVSWLGLWLEVPWFVRIGGVALFAAALLYVLAGLARLSRPSRLQVLSRLDRDSGLEHRPASALEDGLANPGSDPATRALWALHRQRMQALADRLKVALPAPRLVERDKYALRAAALVALVGAAFVAGPERNLRVAAAFDWRIGAAAVQGFRVDAWLDPPPYTGRAPILLDTRAESADNGEAKKIEAPVGSTLILRLPPDAGFKVDVVGALPEIAREPGAGGKPQPASGEVGQRYSLKGDARVSLTRNGHPFASFELHAIPDLPPTIALTEPVQPNVRGSMTLNYKISDDYGVTSAEADFTQPLLRGKAVAGRSLVAPPSLSLTLPATPGGLGEGMTQADLSAHPWAGARATMVLSARDEGGNMGASLPQEIILPQRPFAKPMARALVEQRRNLVMMPDDRDRELSSLDALMIAPEQFQTGAAVYLGLRIARSRLADARSDEDLLGVADFMWEMALRIEDGDLSQTEQDLRAAEARLREAMQRGASDEEISKLMADVRTALDKFMKELAEKQMREDGPPQASNGPRNGRMLTPEDFKAMMDRIEEMARSGNLAEAQKMLDAMQKKLENLQTARRRAQDPQQKQLRQAQEDLDGLSRDEQALRDDTFRQDQQQRQQRSGQNKPGAPKSGKARPDGPKGAQTPDENNSGDNAEKDGSDSGDAQSAESAQKQLQQRQQALRNRLDQLQKRLEQFGQKGQDGLGEALEAMKDAESALGQGESGTGRAVAQEGQALEALRKGAQNLADALQQQGEGGDQAGDDNPGDDGQGQSPGQPRGGKSRDPLARDNTGKTGPNTGGGLRNSGIGPAQRAQKVLEELRRRLGDGNRPAEERDYLGRLLKR